jgi:hypothetical protein
MSEIRIALTQGKFAVVDAADAPIVEHIKWYAIQPKSGYTWYAYNQSIGYMHRIILDAKKGEITDHLNGDGLDNRRANLRICTSANNMANRRQQRNNTSGFRGVSYHKESGKWMAYIKHERVRHYLGLFATAEDAARAYDVASHELHGTWGKQNSHQLS